MKRILVIMDENKFKEITKLKKKNKHTWEQVVLNYLETYNK